VGKEITHILFANEIVRALAETPDNSLAGIPAFAPTSLDLGSIAPDIFFYAIRIPFLERGSCRSGEIIHGSVGNDTGIVPLTMLSELRTEGKGDPLFGEKFAFCCGYLTHMAFDCAFHPYVYYVSGDYYDLSPEGKKNARTRHRLIESWLDVYLLQKLSVEPKDFDALRAMRRERRLNRQLLRFFFGAFTAVREDDSTFEHLLRGFNVQMLLNSWYPKASCGKFFSLLNRLLHGKLDPFVALFYPWGYRQVPREVFDFQSYRHPVTGCEIREDFDGLWKRAGDLAQNFIRAASRYVLIDGDEGRFREVVKGYSLSMGSVGVGCREARHFDNVSLGKLWCHGAPARNLLSK
jgi:hypothetical protein